MKKVKVKTQGPLDHLGRRHLNQLSGESAKGTKVIMKQKFKVLDKNKGLPPKMLKVK
jgi:hypothetical protein